MKRRSGLQEDDDDNEGGSIKFPSTGQKIPTAAITKLSNVSKETRTKTEMKATTACIVDVVDANNYCNKEKGIVSTETSQNPKNDKITYGTMQKGKEDASSEDDENSIASYASTSDRPGAFAIQGPRFNNNANNIAEDGAVQYSTTEEVETATQNQQAEAGAIAINDPLEAEQVLETVLGTSVTLNNSPIKWKQLTILLGIFVFALCTVAVVLIAVFVQSNKNGNKSLSPPPLSTPPVVATVESPSPTDLPTFGPSMIPSAATTSVQEQIIIILSEHFPDLPASNYQQQAFDWIFTDPTSLGVITEEGLTSRNKERMLLERFVLATVYFATNGIRWRRNSFWLSPLHVCQWQGIGGCDAERSPEQEVANLDLRNNNLRGSIPTELGLLTSLTLLQLFDNYLTGSIPTELGLLTSLTKLESSQNALTGSIPTELGLMTSTEWLFLLGNALSGSIPTELGLMTSMKWLSLSANDLTGSIPTELGLMTSMNWLNLWGNALSGSIPTELGLITSMTELYLYDNALFGSIPTELGSMANMGYLFLDNNILTGSIPTEVGILTGLTRLGFSNNSNLTGTIPSEVGAILPNLLGCYMGGTSLVDVPENCQGLSPLI